MDVKVEMSQKWINDTYNAGITVDGKTGWPTINALIRCLQKELKISPQVDFFGTETAFQFENQIGSVKLGSKSNIVGIIQCAMWCKGYSPGSNSISTDFNLLMVSGINKLRVDAGLSSSITGEVDLTIMKALLSMDQYKKIIGSEDADDKIRKAQQYLNGKYLLYSGLMPCDGLYGRNTNKAVIFGLQAEMGMTRSEATGSFGSKTKASLPTISSSAGGKGFIYLFKMALYANMSTSDRAVMTIDDVYDSTLTAKIKKFQTFMKLPVTSIIDKQTWCAVLISCGDNERAGTACDRAAPLTESDAQTVYDAGYRYIGRYLSGTYAGVSSKAMTRSEIKTILKTGLRIYPIFQEDGRDVNKFTPEMGSTNAIKAFQAATILGIPENTIIYFAVDFDALDYQIKSNIIPYFESICGAIDRYAGSAYRVGIYGTRNVCNQVIKAGFAELAFVSDMSYGWSGNLGFPMPEKWAFDQIRTVRVNGVEIDNNIASGADKGFDKIGGVDFVELGEGPYTITSKIAQSSYRMTAGAPLKNVGSIKLEYPTETISQAFYLKKGSLENGAYLISPAANIAVPEKEYVVDRYIGNPKDVADIYIRSDGDKRYQEVKFIPQADGSYQISLVAFNLLLTAVVDTNGYKYPDSQFDMKWLPPGYFKWSSTQLWYLVPTKIKTEEEDETLAGLEVGKTYTISTKGKYLGVPSGVEVYAGAPVKLMDGSTSPKSTRWKLVEKPVGDRRYTFAPVYNTKLAMDWGIDYSSPDIQVNMNANPKTIHFEKSGSQFLIRADSSEYPLYLSVERPEIGAQASFIDSYDVPATVWNIERAPDTDDDISDEDVGNPGINPPNVLSQVNIMTRYNAPIPISGSEYTINNIPDITKNTGFDNATLHCGSGFNQNGEFRNLNGNQVSSAISSFIKSVYGSSYSPSEANYCYFLFGEHDSNHGYHHGVDMQVSDGADIKALYGGEVTVANGTDAGFGLVGIYVPALKVTTFYMHMKNHSVTVGTTIKAGTILGQQSNVGAVGSHLHFEVRAGKQSHASNYTKNVTDKLTSIIPYGYMIK